MIVELMTEELQYLYETPIDALKGKQEYSKDIIKQYKKKVDILIAISEIEDLYQFGGLNFEKLKGDRKDFYSIRLNKQYRLIFNIIQEEGSEPIAEIIQVTEISKHYE